MTQSEYLVRVGIDWASESHQICILDQDGHRTEYSVPHTSAGLAALATELVALSPEDPGRVAVAIEVPRGPVVDTLLSVACTSSPSTPSNWTASAIAIPSRAPRTTAGMPSSSPIRCAPTGRPFAARSSMTP